MTSANSFWVFFCLSFVKFISQFGFLIRMNITTRQTRVDCQLFVLLIYSGAPQMLFLHTHSQGNLQIAVSVCCKH